MAKKLGLVFVFLFIIEPSLGFYIPGTLAKRYYTGADVDVYAVKMTSLKTQLPYMYYSLNFCKPNGSIVYSSQNMGEILKGNRIVNTPFKIKMNKDEDCLSLCPPINLTASESSLFAKRILNTYFVHLMVDDLPVVTKYGANKQRSYTPGYLLGFSKNESLFLNNHLKFLLKYNTESEKIFNVVGFEIETSSIAYNNIEVDNKGHCTINSKVDKFQEIVNGQPTTIQFTYEVQWIKSYIRWESRWEPYILISDGQIHWFSIFNSIVVIIFLSGILTMIMIRTLRKDIAIYNKDQTMEEAFEESGWKLVHGDVFRPPSRPQLFAALVGSGVQIFCVVLVVIFFAMCGTLLPSDRGALLNVALFTYAFMGVFAGYFAGRIYKTFQGSSWIATAIETALLYPGIIFGIGFILNLFIWGKSSSAAVPFATMITLWSLWFGVSSPLVFAGFYFGFRKQSYVNPVRTKQIPRAIPIRKFYHNLILSILSAGLLPFGAVFIELFFVFSAIWEKEFYYLFGFLFIVFNILIVSVAQVSIVMLYLQLCSENYHWWWRTFITSGGSALYVFGYTIFYYFTKLHISEFIPTLIYFSYSLMIVVTFWFLTGTIGFYASYCFIKQIYSAIKVD